MKKLTLDIDYTYCPKGHGDWVYIPSSTLYSDLWWCKDCDCFYQPSVKRIEKGVINKNFNSDREKDLRNYADFLQWKQRLSIKDYREAIKND